MKCGEYADCIELLVPQEGLKFMELLRIWRDRRPVAHNTCLVIRSSAQSNFHKLRTQ